MISPVKNTQHPFYLPQHIKTHMVLYTPNQISGPKIHMQEAEEMLVS